MVLSYIKRENRIMRRVFGSKSAGKRNRRRLEYEELHLNLTVKSRILIRHVARMEEGRSEN